MKKWLLTAAFAATIFVGRAEAHFLWVGAAGDAGKQTQHVWFSEAPEPGEAHLVDKIAHSKAWAQCFDGSERPLMLEKKIEGDLGGLACKAAAGNACDVDAICDYGVITRGGETFLLQYYAKHRPQLDDAFGDTNDNRKLQLEVFARRVGKKLQAKAHFDGRPVADAKLTLFLPNGEQIDCKLDDSATAETSLEQHGQYGLLVAYSQKDQAGQRDGKQYQSIRHYSTLTFEVPEPAKTAAASDTVTAKDLLADARAARAVWNGFHGFRAQATVTIDSQSETGNIEVDENGVATTHFKSSEIKDWVENQLASLVQHRMPADDDDENVTYADDSANHPLGRSITLGNRKDGSVYRIKDRMVTEVNRKAGPTHFTISVLEAEWNAEGKYLPRVVTLSSWKSGSEELRSNTTVRNTWRRVGDFDVPSRIFEVSSSNNARHVRQIDLENIELLK